MKSNIQIFFLACLASWSVHFASAQTNTPPAHLAGRYAKQDFGSEWVSLGGDGKYTNGLWFCSRGNYRDSGTFTLSSNLLIFKTDDPSRNPGPLRPVNWGRRLYLLRPDDIPAFHAAIASKEEPRSSEFGKFIMRENDWKVPASGFPDLPHAPNKPTEKKTTAVKPAKGRIIEVIDQSSAWINLGSEHGVDNGMTITGKGKRKPTTYNLDRVFERQSIVSVRSGDAPRLGDAVTALDGH